MAWEKAFLEYMKEYVVESSNRNLTISFSVERAIEDELDRESNTDIIIIFVSYMTMFLYITVALGQFQELQQNFGKQKILHQRLLTAPYTSGTCSVSVLLASWNDTME